VREETSAQSGSTEIALIASVESDGLTMSSREIAELTGKQHRNVKRDIETMMTTLEVDMLRFEHIYRDGQNRKQTEYRLPKRETLILVSGYNIQLRAKIVDRWAELEALDEKGRSKFGSVIKMLQAIDPNGLPKFRGTYVDATLQAIDPKAQLKFQSSYTDA